VVNSVSFWLWRRWMLGTLDCCIQRIHVASRQSQLSSFKHLLLRRGSRGVPHVFSSCLILACLELLGALQFKRVGRQGSTAITCHSIFIFYIYIFKYIFRELHERKDKPLYQQTRAGQQRARTSDETKTKKGQKGARTP
jgi:hypothetical protein